MRQNPHKNFRYEEAAKELKKLLFQIAEIKQSDKESFVYKGPDIKSSSVLSTSHDIKTSFTKDQIQYDKERNRDLIDIFISKVFQLGYSVAYENCYESYNPMLSIVKDLLNKKEKDG